MRNRLTLVIAGLIAANILVWAWAFSALHGGVLLGTALLAYGLGLRHAVDADHIAAIDNVTRRLMERGQRPVGVGLFFSLGHSSVVVAASLAVAAGADGMRPWIARFHDIGGVVGTLVSAGFLLAIAAANAVVLVDVVRRLRSKAGGDAGGVAWGFLGRLFRPLFGMISQSWQMYPLGLLFGLGFDTATEIALLGISAAEASHGLPIWSILVFPALFTAGMSLVDTADSVLMLGAYGWAFGMPQRRLHYNLVITSLSVLVAVLVGGLEAFGLLAGRYSWQGVGWRLVSAANTDFGLIGLAVIVVFTLCWLGSMLAARRTQNQ